MDLSAIECLVLNHEFSTVKTIHPFHYDKRGGVVRPSHFEDNHLEVKTIGDGTTLDKLSKDELKVLVDGLLRRGASTGWVVFDTCITGNRWSTVRNGRTKKREYRSPALRFSTNHKASFNVFVDAVLEELQKRYKCKEEEAVLRWRAEANIEYAVEIVVAAMKLIKKYKLRGIHYFNSDGKDYIPSVSTINEDNLLNEEFIANTTFNAEYNLWYMNYDSDIINEALHRIEGKEQPKLRSGDLVNIIDGEKSGEGWKVEKVTGKSALLSRNRERMWVSRIILRAIKRDNTAADNKYITPSHNDEKNNRIADSKYTVVDLTDEKLFYSCSHIEDYPGAKYCPSCGIPAIRTEEWDKGQALQLLDHAGKLSRLPITLLEQIIQTNDSNPQRYINLDTGKPISMKGASERLLFNENHRICSYKMGQEDFKKVVDIFNIVTKITSKTDFAIEEQIATIYNEGINPVRRSSRVTISSALHEKILNKAKGQCYCCGAGIASLLHELAHIVPHRHGGLASKDNLVACCSACNKAMSSINLFEWMIINNKKGGMQCLEEEKRGTLYNGKTYNQWITCITSLQRRTRNADNHLKTCKLSKECRAQILTILHDPVRFSIEQREQVLNLIQL